MLFYTCILHFLFVYYIFYLPAGTTSSLKLDNNDNQKVTCLYQLNDQSQINDDFNKDSGIGINI